MKKQEIIDIIKKYSIYNKHNNRYELEMNKLEYGSEIYWIIDVIFNLLDVEKYEEQVEISEDEFDIKFIYCFTDNIFETAEFQEVIDFINNLKEDKFIILDAQLYYFGKDVYLEKFDFEKVIRNIFKDEYDKYFWIADFESVYLYEANFEKIKYIVNKLPYKVIATSKFFVNTFDFPVNKALEKYLKNYNKYIIDLKEFFDNYFNKEEFNKIVDSIEPKVEWKGDSTFIIDNKYEIYFDDIDFQNVLNLYEKIKIDFVNIEKQLNKKIGYIEVSDYYIVLKTSDYKYILSIEFKLVENQSISNFIEKVLNIFNSRFGSLFDINSLKINSLDIYENIFWIELENDNNEIFKFKLKH